MAEIELSEHLSFLFEPKRYKVLYGGRGSGKSVGCCDALLIKGAERPLRILCARELQNSIRESVHRLLADEIDRLGLGGFYEVQQTSIRGANGTELIFKGLRHNIAEIKSLQGVDICWVEEAQSVSRSSWDTLIPTIRQPGSEIWITFNPELETDETYERFVLGADDQVEVRKVNWSENPWFPEVLRLEKDRLQERDHDSYLTVWEGHCRQTLEGAIYAAEIRAATADDRITDVPYDDAFPVETFWDLGWADHTAIWFAQNVAGKIHIIDYHEDRQRTLGHYFGLLRERPYKYGTMWLPHDAKHGHLASQRSIEAQAQADQWKTQIVPNLKVAEGINAGRTVFPSCWFDAKKCADGLNALRRYRYDVDPETKQFSKDPLHDAASHGADAFRYMAVAKVPRPTTTVRTLRI